MKRHQSSAVLIRKEQSALLKKANEKQVMASSQVKLSNAIETVKSSPNTKNVLNKQLLKLRLKATTPLIKAFALAPFASKMKA